MDSLQAALGFDNTGIKERRGKSHHICIDPPPVAALVVLELLLTTTLNRSAPTQEHPSSPSLVGPLLHFVCDTDRG